jgi:hypothetical protein
MREVLSHKFPEIQRSAALREMALIINELIRGRINSLIRGTSLTINSATTTITDPKITITSALFFSPKTANAAVAMQTMYVSAIAKGVATLTHANNAQADRTFDILVKSGEYT